MANVTKLIPTNYLMWKLQVSGYGLLGYLDGSIVIPSATTTTNDVTLPNPEFDLWKRQDNLLYSSLLGFISLSVQPLLSRITSSAAIWTTLAETYTQPSRGHVQQLRDQLRLWKKADRTIDEYFQGLTTHFDTLANLGKPMDHEDQIELILDGLPDDYRLIVDHIESRDAPPSLAYVHERLLNREARLLFVSAAVPSLLLVTTNVATIATTTTTTTIPTTTTLVTMPTTTGSDTHQIMVLTTISEVLTPIKRHSSSSCLSQQSPFTPWQPLANLAIGSPYNADLWVLDSGATHHLTSDLQNLALHRPYTGGEDVVIGDGSGLLITHTGSTILSTLSKSFELENVLCVPNIHKNLIYVYRFCNANQVSIKFFPAWFQVKDLSTRVRLLQDQTKNDLYEWPISASQAAAFYASPTPKTTLSSWHARLGHPSASVLQTIVSRFSLPLSSSASAPLSCSECLLNKTHKLSFASSFITSVRPLQYLFTDVWTSPVASVDNFKYYLILVDHFTRYTWFYPLRNKSVIQSVFKAFKPLVENHFWETTQTLYSDNGGEYIALRGYLASHGISHYTTPPHTLEHNGISERKHRHIVETGLALLSQASMPLRYWSYAFSTAVYLINRLPTPSLSDISPYHKLFAVPPNYNKLRVFGCACFPWLRPYTSHKLDARSKRCVFLGYSLTQSAYCCLDVQSGRVYVSRHVQFLEIDFPFRCSVLAPATSDNGLTPTASVIPLVQSFAPCLDPHHPSLSPSQSTSSANTTTVPATPLPLNASPPLVLSPAVSSPSPVNLSSPISSSSISSPSSSKPTAPTENGPQPTAHTLQPPPNSVPQLNNSHQTQTQTRVHQQNSVTDQNDSSTSPSSPTRSVTSDSSSSSNTHSAPANAQAPPPPPTNIHPMSTKAKTGISKPNKRYLLTASLPSTQNGTPHY
ncbi:PREDICTED: uncharacterized protein LOC104784298 [Camelina sativa]|uniref:Uncharacterized protein LOC104784298 n=1 Tax=Camelina sativa TaxID=90675 RepID=A0ABM0YXW1_CAMSA|nr:PREDICTED: uncharacterized protein LOC104784298 [Camelina sativa]